MSPFERIYKAEYAAELLAIAEGDLESASVLASSERGRPKNACYLAHQCVEKCLKAVLCLRGRAILHTHDIEALLVSLPSDVEGPLQEHSLAAVTLADRVLAWARLIASSTT